MREALSSKSVELDKLSDVQAELMAQLRDSNRELERLRALHQQASEDARAAQVRRQQQCREVRHGFERVTGRLLVVVVVQARSEELSREVQAKDAAHAEMQVGPSQPAMATSLPLCTKAAPHGHDVCVCGFSLVSGSSRW